MRQSSTIHLVEINDAPIYLSRIPVDYDTQRGYVYLRFDRRIKGDNSIYPELLLETAGSQIAERNFDYAVYLRGQLQEHDGEYAYPFRYSGLQPELGINYSSRENGVRQTVYGAAEDKLVVVTRESEGWLKPVSLFSYLFLFFLLLSLVAGTVYLLSGLVTGGLKAAELFQTSLRGRIQSLVVILIIGSFLVIGAVTLLYFHGRYDDYHRSRLLRKVRAVEAEILYQAEESADNTRRKDIRWPFMAGFPLDLAAVSEIHAIDVNLFDLNGNLVSSSQPEIFEQGLVSRKMSPGAWHRLHRLGESQHVQEEHIGTLEYLGAYIPLRSRSGLGIGYLHLPYFAKEKNLREEVSTFMTALINVYVLLLVAAGFLALVLSNSITRSLALISARFREVQLMGGNEPIAWNSQDEIGILVNEYNKMLAQLEHSADLLARSERESAWREMAKQVAHEIKNPLTPMRLSIQHLQRAWANDDPRAVELAKRVNKTLLEQIDNLSRIATEFSDFAKMPKAVREEMVLGEVIDAAVDLFAKDEAVEITWSGSLEPIWVYADRHQLIRVFNNLIKNAIQAIPDDREGKIKVNLVLTEQKVDVRVSDNGIGIPEDRRKDVFVPNFTTKNSGMGLGLSMCKNIVESAGGEIWFESVVDVGTTFHVVLPLLTNKSVMEPATEA